MINQNLHRQPLALDTAQHRTLKLKVPVTEWGLASRLNALFIIAAEFGEACRDFPIVFVKAGKEDDGSDAIAPIAVMGLKQQQNLYVTGEQWRARYMPAIMRLYPFCISRLDAERFAICMDMAFSGINTEVGEPLFDAEGKPAELLLSAQKQLEVLETEIQRTRLVGRRLQQLGVLREMRFDATLPDGTKHTVDGFLTVDDEKMAQLADADVLELHRSGVLGLVHLHWASMGNMRRLVEWYVERAAAAPEPTPVPGTAPATA